MFHLRRQISLGGGRPSEDIMALLTSFLGKQSGSKRKSPGGQGQSIGNSRPAGVSRTFQERQKRGDRLAFSGTTLLGG